MSAGPRKRIAVLISGRGSNLGALLRADLAGTIVVVGSNRAEAAGLAHAQAAGVPTVVVPHADFATREAFDRALLAALNEYAPDLVVLAGFMRILTPVFTSAYAGRLINIHPSLLPAFPGLNTHARALAEGVKLHGCTVHFVTPELDRGPIIAQAAVPVEEDDTPETLAARVLAEEHRILPWAVRLFCEQRLVVEGMRVRVLAKAL
ncbi:MAG: phosphoribosylglycinamide formyltransferase [Casimicrobiaceae bacterium]|nr:phosphoribosylglycinamide formyltransferase [Casimicrobiaceae bacterium]MDW8312246.1 phosphoribosylglycinamide formyltransferase [Burkholderiales bacterium]